MSVATIADLVNGTGDQGVQTRMRAIRQTRLTKPTSDERLARTMTAPPPTSIFAAATGGVDAITFVFAVVDSPLVYGYRVYSSATNSPDSAQRIGFVSQPSDGIGQIKYQDQVGSNTSKFYWVSTVNSQGVESPRTAMQLGTSPATTGASTTNITNVTNNVVNNVTQNTVASVLTFELPGTLVVSNSPSAPPVVPVRILNNQTFGGGVVARVTSAPTGSSIILTWGRTPPGGARIVLATLTIPAGATVSNVSGSVSFSALDMVDILISQVGSTSAGDNLITGIAS